MWIAIATLTAICWGLCYVAIGQLIKDVDKYTYIFISSIINAMVYGTLCSKTTAGISENRWWLAIALFTSVAGNFLSLYAIQLKDATHAASVEISYPIWCALFSFLIFGSQLNLSSVIGMALVIAGTSLFVFSQKHP